MKLTRFPLTHSNEIRIVHLRRSGGHAITNWIISNLPEGPVCYLNDVNNNYDNPENHKGYPRDACSSTPALNHASINRKSRLDCAEHLVLSFEEATAMRWATLDLDTGGPPPTIVWIFRDLVECFASRLARADNPSHANLKWVRDLVADRSPEGCPLLLHHFIETVALAPEGHVFIDYQLWNTSRSYRDGVARKLGLGTADKGKNEIPAWGMGSSFGEPPKAGQLRAPQYEDDPRMIHFKNALLRVLPSYLDWYGLKTSASLGLARPNTPRRGEG